MNQKTRMAASVMIFAAAFSCQVVGVSLNQTFEKKKTELSENLVEIDGSQYQKFDDMLIPFNRYETKSQFDTGISKWTDGIVYYEFDPQVSSENKQNFLQATQYWTAVAELKFIERVEQENYVYVQNGTSNSAIVGMVGGRQYLSMNNWENIFVIVHELGHSLGMRHEHQRANRDDYVDIMIDNVLDNRTHNFTLKTTSDYGSYDFLSVMHYPEKAFTKNGQITIQAKPEYEKYQKLMGQRKFFSGGEQLSVASHYGAKIIDIPDPNFKSYLVAEFDLNGDGEIDSLEAAKIEAVYTPGNGNISSIKGVEFFRFLKILNVSNENLSEIPELPNHLTDINLSNNHLDLLEERWALPPLLENLDVSNNQLDEYSCNAIDFVSSVLGNNQPVYNPVKNGGSFSCEGDAQFVLYHGKARENLMSKGSQVYNIEVSEGTAALRIETTLFEDKNGGEMNLYAAANRTPTTSDFDAVSTNPGNLESIIVDQPESGVWYILLEPVESSFEHVNLTAYLENTTEPDKKRLTNGLARASLAANQNEQLTFYFEVPQEAKNVSFEIYGGVGDADLYVRHGQEPSLSQYDCRPWKSGNEESCNFSQPSEGIYYVMLNGYNSFSDLTLVASYQIDDVPQGGSLERSNLSDFRSGWKYFEVNLPEGMTSFDVEISGGSGDADLYLNPNNLPTTAEYFCRPYKDGNSENCSISNPEGGKWYIGIRAYDDYTNVTLNVQWIP
ncbi:pre-peptidase C-terminal domain-containing protein [Aliikangiella sp. G2MR2-5]|uniref:pre-peptidase C-terminal domain-containing protein n=1 Tax=Aliikangiella sp. G2MR2-5 TaxID=2788943 RepID=UPI0018AC6673|nr:pre-peptidase C-terminal domain-containing protein [Aliikangiella sp. G2MR2-5]